MANAQDTADRPRRWARTWMRRVRSGFDLEGNHGSPEHSPVPSIFDVYESIKYT